MRRELSQVKLCQVERVHVLMRSKYVLQIEVEEVGSNLDAVVSVTQLVGSLRGIKLMNMLLRRVGSTIVGPGMFKTRIQSLKMKNSNVERKHEYHGNLAK
jgi:hypothetical protein